jgi:hypothetical protein
MRYLTPLLLLLLIPSRPAIAQERKTYLSEFAEVQMRHYGIQTEFSPQLNDARLADAQAYCQFLADGGTGGQWSKQVIEQHQNLKQVNPAIAQRVWRERIPTILIATAHFCPEQDIRSQIGL